MNQNSLYFYKRKHTELLFPLEEAAFRFSFTKWLLKEWDYNYLDSVFLCKFPACKHLFTILLSHFWIKRKLQTIAQHSNSSTGGHAKTTEKAFYLLFLICLIFFFFSSFSFKTTISHYILTPGLIPAKKLKVHPAITGGHLHLLSQPTQKSKQGQEYQPSCSKIEN